MGRDFPAAIRNRAKRPDLVGMDRLANAVAAWARVKGPCVAVDVGTAVTFDVVNGRGEFVGGMIAPGPALQARSLHEHTARLPEVKVKASRRAIGRFTEEAIEAGVHLGLVGLVKEGLSRIGRELGARPRSLATGGGGTLVRDCVDEVADWLTLEGIARSAMA
jgi:type III pantothenate kinase